MLATKISGLTPQADIANPMLPPAAIFCMLAYVDNPNDTNSGGQLNIEAAVQSIFPTCQVVWSSTNTYDDNYAYIVQAPGPNYECFLTVRGSLPFEANGQVVIDWATIANWLLEDFDIYTQGAWVYADSDNAYIASGSLKAFTNIQTATNFIGGTGQDAYSYLVANAVGKGYPVYITGHSLGGNIANVYASYFAQQLAGAGLSNANNFLFTFAAPAAGNQDFAADLDGKFPAGQAYHYQLDNDIIPRFPVVSDVEELESMFQPAPLASAISWLDVTLADTIQGVVDTIKGDIDIDLIDAYVQTAVTIAPHALAASWTSNTFSDWFLQALYQHQVSGYLGIFWNNAGAAVAAAAPQITKASSVHTVQPVAAGG
jgi:triacylglycerol lipase